MCDVCDQTDQASSPMDQTIKADWVKALRSGEYEQGSGSLNKAGKFCCLGVLCDLAVKAGVPVQVRQAACDCLDDWDDDPEHRCTPDVEEIEYDFNSSYPPIKVQDWAGITSPDPVVAVPESDDPGKRSSLSVLNDEGRTFAEIADLIEEQL